MNLPEWLNEWHDLQRLNLDGNPLNPELAAAYKEGLDAVKRYLRAKAAAQVVLNEVKLILIGEGEVGKSCLLGALRGDQWEEGKPTTHGIEIKPVKVTDPATGTEITLNGWDFGGQRVYRPTHQLFFTAPAVYLVVWKPREGPQQGFVKEWIKLVKHREPEAKILVVATHGGPKERQPDIDRQEIWDLFGRETVVDFITIDSKPNEQGERPTIEKLKTVIVQVAASLPEMGRTFPKHWQEAREALRNSNEAWLPLDRVFAICKEHKVDEEDARLLLLICRRVGDLIHYEHDPALRDIVILKPDWLATAISFVLDDEHTRNVGHGLVSFERLGLLWNDPDRPEENRYPERLHPIFLRLMERFDLSYRIAEQGRNDADGTSLIAQLVPDVRPEKALMHVWPASPFSGDEQQVQICRIVETKKNQSVTAEGIFYRLIVRLHKYSLGRANHHESVHWQRGLVLEDDTGARAFLEHIDNDVRITVRSPFAARFLSVLTYEVKWLVENPEQGWKGMRCDVMVPCLMKANSGTPCIGLFEVGNLLENKKRKRFEVPCTVCNEWQPVVQLLGNAPAAQPNPLEELLAHSAEAMRMLREVREQLGEQHAQVIGRFDHLDASGKELVSKVEGAYDSLIHTLLDEAKEGPRLFSFQPVDPGFFERPRWISQKFRLTLWCEHSRQPLPELNGKKSKAGVYELTLPREWFEKAAPFLKVLTGTLSLVLPVAASATKFIMDDTAYKGLEKELDLGQKSLESVLKGGEQSGAWLGRSDAPELERGEAIRAQGAVLRQLHAWLKEKDPSFGGLIRVQNKRQEFLWVHPQFEGEY
ncbi:COR domain-containing protein [Chlorobaculum limnaeum]|uniref:COR domain-containing protein n=1 Tax=Chlorobaculum limnaeum TaxID=274537 RepID=UPI000A453CB9|nr:COR domain-containing protein [Chlorobaculum limnaeum]